MSSPIDLLQSMTGEEYSHLDRAVALLWWYDYHESGPVRDAKELADRIKAAGYAQQNVTRLRGQLEGDSRVVKRDDGFRAKVQARDALTDEFGALTGPQRPPVTSAVLPIELFFDTRDYLENIVEQANAAYEHALFDCCAVMLRRLAETLIILVYEHESREDEIKDGNDRYFLFSKLIKHVENDDDLDLSHRCLKGLKEFKRLGNLSAHKRRYNAVQDDIDRVRDGLREAAEELMYHSGIKG